VTDVEVNDLIFKNKKIQGFWTTRSVKDKNIVGMYFASNKIKSLIKTTLSTEISKKFSLKDFKEAIQYYKENMSKGKVVFRPWQLGGNHDNSPQQKDVTSTITHEEKKDATSADSDEKKKDSTSTVSDEKKKDATSAVTHEEKKDATSTVTHEEKKDATSAVTHEEKKDATSAVTHEE
jgi:hypothetical protein